MKTFASLSRIVIAMILLVCSSEIFGQCNVTSMGYTSVPGPSCGGFVTEPVSPGGFFNLPLTPGTYYDYGYSANGCGNTSGMCITGLNGSGFTNFSNVTTESGWFSGTCTSVQLSSFKTGATNGCSALLLYKYSTPATPVFASAPVAVCNNVNVTYAVNTVSAATAYVWTVTGAGGTILSGQNTPSINVVFTKSGTATVSVHATNNGFCNSGTNTTSTITVAGVSIASSQTICGGNSVTLTATPAGGTGTPSYQWQSSPNQSTWTNTGTNSTSYPTGALSSTTSYRCIYSNTGMGCTSVTSNVDTISIGAAQPAITSQPANTSICDGNAGSLSVAATGGSGLTYQWQYFNGSGYVNVTNGLPAGVNYTTATSPSLAVSTTNGTTPAGAYQYHCIINSLGGCSSLTSNAATVTVVAQPVITSQTNTDSICGGNSTTMNVTVTGGGTLSYQWMYFNGSSYVAVANGVPTGVTYSNANTSTLSLVSSSGTPAGTYSYHCVVTSANGCTGVTSNTALLTVYTQPAITATTATDTVCDGNSTNISVTATNAGAYQWQYYNGVSFVNVASGTPAGVTYTSPTSAVLGIATTNGTTPAGSYRYQCLVTSSGGCTTVISSGTTVTVTPSAPSAPTLLSTTNISCNSFTASWTASVNATSYYFDVALDAGFTDFVPGWDEVHLGNVTSVNVTGLTAWLPYYYRVRAADNCTGAYSASAEVFTLPAAPAAPSDNSYYNFEYTTVPASNYQLAFAIYGSGNPSFLEDFSVVSGTPNIYATGSITGVNAFEGNQYAISGVCDVAANYSEGVQVNHAFVAGKSYNVTLAIRNIPYPPNATPNPIDVQFVLLQSPMASTFIPGSGCSPTPAIPSNGLVVNSISHFATNAWGVISFPVSGLTANYSQLWIREVFSTGDPLVTTLFAFDSVVINQTSTGSEQASSITCNSFVANWAAVENATGYFVDVSTNSGFTSFVSGWNNYSAGNLISATVTGLTAGTTYYYRVRAVDNCGTSSNSTTASVTIASQPVITTQPASTVTICRGDSASVNVAASGTLLTYQWQYDNAGNWSNAVNNIPAGINYWGANTAVLNYTTTTSTAPGTYQYRCIISSVGGCGNDTSTVTSLVVNSAPAITSCPGSLTMNTDPSLCDATVYYPAAVVTGSPAPTVTYTYNSGSIFPLGTTAITVTATNSCGTATCSFDVTVVDRQPPSIMCPGTQNLNLGANCSVLLHDYTSLAITSDNCSSGESEVPGGNAIVVTQSPAPGDTLYGVGITTVTLTATDSTGNSNSCTFNVTVTDSTLPVAICRSISVYLDNTGNASISASDINNGSYDNCGIASVTVSPNTFTCANAGANTVILTVTDVNGNVSTCTSTVTVLDTIAPVAICKALTVQLDGSGNAYITADMVNNGSSDNCGIQSVTVSPSVFTCSNIGANTVTLTVTDVNGNVSTCSSTVTVQDVLPPTAICKEATVHLDASGSASVTADQLDGGSYDNCGIASLSVSPNTFICSNIGPNTVTLTVTDVNGNSSSCTTTVQVMDAIAPTAICQDVTVQLDASGNASVTAAQVNNGSYDNCGIGYLNVSPNTFTCSSVGANAVTLTVTDVNGNVSTCSSTVTVQDNIAPVAVCQNVTVYLDATGNASVTAAQVDNGSYDNCGIASLSVSPNTFTCSNAGTNSVTLTVTDVNGNVSTCTSTVTVLDAIAPAAVCQPVTVYLDGSGNASVTPAQINNGSSDNCSIVSLTVSPNTFTCSNVGNNSVTLTVTDVNGNVSTCTTTVTVLDTTAPTVVCQPVTVQLDGSGNASVTAGQVNNGSSDNCSIASLSVSPNTFTCSNVGANTVALTVTDVNGNVSTCSTTVTVQDNIAPTAMCKNATVYLDATGNASVTAGQIDNGSVDNCGIALLSVSPNAFTCTNIGANTVTLTVTDVNGNVSTCTATVTVLDTIAPVAICKAATVQLDASGNASITVSQINNGSYDNCGIASVTVSPSVFNCSNVGANTVTLTVTDVNGNVSTCTSVVTVVDNTAPVAICQAVTVQLDASGNASVTAAQVNNGSHDNCGIASLSVSPNTFTCGNVGVNTVTLTVTDVNGNVSTCSTTVTVQDNIAPTALCKNATVYLNATGNAAVTAGQIDNGSVDNCGIASLSVSPNTFTCANVGANTVTLTVTDVNGNVSTCSATVTVLDTIAPVAICKAATIQLDASGNASITASQINNGSYDNCGIASVTVSPSAFNCSNVGANTVTLTVTDVNGNVSTCTSVVTVVDNTAPVAICQAVTVQLDASGNASVTAAQVNNGSYDNCGIASLSVSPNTFTCGNVGANTVTLTVTDVNGNASTCTTTVTVQDNIAPTAMCKNATVYLDATGDASVTAGQIDNGSVDNCGIASLSVSPNTFTCANAGANTITLMVTDVNGNVSTCAATVTVLDTIAPVAICKAATVQLDASGNASITASQINNGSYDNCGIASVTVSPSAFNCSNVGANTVTLTVTDVNGNVSTCTSVVTVVDNTAPVAICQAVTVQLDASGNALVTAVQVNNGSYDNCGIASLSVSPDAFTCGNVGANTVTLTVTDVNGNVSTCSTTVTVQDNIAPTALCKNATVYLDASGNASVTAGQIDNGSVDNCGIASLSVSPNTFTCTNVGANTVTLTITDVNGNVSTCAATVTVLDTIAPVAICKAATVQLDASGNASITTSQINNGSYDNCGIASLSASPNTFTCGNVGANTVTLTVTDVNGNVSTCSTTVTVQDNIAPTALCKNATVYLNASGNASVSAAQLNNGSYDNCGITSIAVSPNIFTCTHVGANTVTLTVTDVNRNVSTCTATVTVLDIIAPVAICKAATVQLDASGSASITASQINNGSYDNCGIASVTVSPSAFNCSNVGSNTVTLTVTDVNGNVSSCTSVVTVVDNTAPVAICHAVTVQLDASGNASVTAAQVNNGSHDNCGIASMSVSPNTFTCGNVGVNTVTLTVTDVNGNVSTCTSTVTVLDNVAPNAVCKPVTVYLNSSGTVSVTAAQVDNGSADACGIASRSVSPSSFTCANLGANTVTLTVTDVHGNVGTCSSAVTVADTIKPTAICKNLSVTLGSGGSVSITASQVNNGSYDNCSIASMTVSPSTFTCSNIGANTVTFTVTDVAGNVSTCHPTVTVSGSLPVCSLSYTPSSNNIIGSLDVGGITGTIFLGFGPQSFILNSTVSGGSSFTYSWTGADLSCYTCANPVFTPTSAGNYHFTLTVTNNYGCSSTCSITICVIDVVDPDNSGKIFMCQTPPGNLSNAHTISISVNPGDVLAHLALGCYLGPCGATCGNDKSGEAHNLNTDYVPAKTDFDVHIFPNPFTSDFQLRIESTSDEKINLRIFNLLGQLIEERFDVAFGADINMGANLADGVYLVEVKQAQQTKVMRVVKSE